MFSLEQYCVRKIFIFLIFFFIFFAFVLSFSLTLTNIGYIPNDVFNYARNLDKFNTNPSYSAETILFYFSLSYLQHFFIDIDFAFLASVISSFFFATTISFLFYYLSSGFTYLKWYRLLPIIICFHPRIYEMFFAGIRSGIAFCIFFIALYIIKKPSTVLILIVLSAIIHQSMAILGFLVLLGNILKPGLKPKRFHIFR